MSYLQDVSAGKEKKKVKKKSSGIQARKGADGLHREPRSHADQQVHSATEEEDSRDEVGAPKGDRAPRVGESAVPSRTEAEEATHGDPQCNSALA